MAFTYVTITHTFETAADLAAAGQVDFQPVSPMHNGITVVARKITAQLTGAGLLSQLLAANTDPGTLPTGTVYQVTERISGQSPFTYYVQVPHDRGSTLDLRDLAGWVGNTSGGSGVLTVNGEDPDGFGNIVVSAADIGAQPADADLAGLATLGDGFPYRASSVWSARTGGQLRDDLGLMGTYPVAYSDFAAAANGAPTALSTGQAATTFGNASLTVTSGALVHTPFNGSNSAGYLQSQLSSRLRRIGATVSWASGANGGLVLVVPLAAWVNNSYTAAGVHLVVYGNGQWHCSYWNGTNETNYLQWENDGKFTDCRDGVQRDVEVWLDPDQARVWIILPDGKTVTGTHSAIGTHTSTYAVWELYESDGTTTTPGKIHAVWADSSTDFGTRTASIKTLAKVGAGVNTAIAGTKRVITEYTASASNVTVPSGCLGALVTIIARGGAGGSGRRGAAGTVRCGGGAGGSGGIIDAQWVSAARLGTTYSITVGSAGAPGAAVTTDDTNGNSGTTSGATIFTSGSTTLRAVAGGPGAGGTAATGTGGNAGAPLGVAGSSASTTGGAGSAGSTVTTGGPGPGGSGGGISTANAAANGGVGGVAYVWGANTGGAAGLIDSTVPGSGGAAVLGRPGDGAGGGASSLTLAAQAGATALGYGSGGGGGGASVNGQSSGAGGQGGPDYVCVALIFA